MVARWQKATKHCH